MSAILRFMYVPALGLPLLFAGEARATGELLFPECSPGTVVDASSGGDLSEAPRYATGLGQVNDVCQGPGGRIFVAACSRQAVFDITGGGDFSTAEPFASGLGCAVGLHCDETRILVADYNGRVIDVTAGGDFTDDMTRVTPNSAVDVTVDSDGRIWVGSVSRGLIDVTEPGNYAPALADASWTDGSSYGSFGAFMDELYVSSSGDGGIYTFTGAGDLTGQRFVDNLGERPGAIVETPNGAFVLNESGVFDVTGGGDFADAVPFATGIDHGCTVAGGVYVHGCGDGFVLPAAEECDDGNDDDLDACSNTCTSNVVDEGTESSGASEGGDASGTSGESESTGGVAADGDGSSGGGGETRGPAESSDAGGETGIEVTDGSTAGDSSTGAADTTGTNTSTSTSTTGVTSVTSSGGTAGTSTTHASATSTETTGEYTGPLDDDGCSCDASRPRSRGAGWLLLCVVGWCTRRRGRAA